MEFGRRGPTCRSGWSGCRSSLGGIPVFAAASTSPIHTAHLREVLVEDLYRRALVPMLFSVPIFYLLYRVLENAIAARPVIAWVFVGMIGVLIPRMITVLAGEWIKRRFPDPRIRIGIFAAEVGLLGFGMAAINILAAPVVGPEELAIMAIIAAGNNSIAIISMSPSLSSYLLYMVPNIASMAIAVVIGPQLQFGGTLLFLICLNLVSLVVMATYVHLALRKSISLHLQVDEANDALRESNAKLESEIAERLAAERTLRQRIFELEVSNRRLAEGIAHEINNPLAFVRSNFNHLAKCTQDMLGLLDVYADRDAGKGAPADISRRLQRLKSAANLDFMREGLPRLLNASTDGLERVARIVSDLKDFTNIDRAQWQLVDL